MTFREMLSTALAGYEVTQQDFARGVGISAQYLNDLVRGRKNPSVRVVEKICEYLGRGPRGRHEWHVAGARAQGWQI